MASSKGASGARRSAIAERARLQAEWAALKNSDSPDLLRGIVALVDVGEGSKGIALRAALAALGATVAPEWSPLVTHVVWTSESILKSSEGSRSIRAAARSLAARVVSPLWVEACAAATRRLPERAFPTCARASDLPSPRALRQMLRDAEKDNVTLRVSLSDTTNITQCKPKDKPVTNQKLRISSENETSDQSTDKSGDQSTDCTILPSRVNTAPRRALPTSITPDIPEKKSKRKLFTYKEAEVAGSSSTEDEEDDGKISVPKPSLPSQKTKPKIKLKIPTHLTKKITQQERKDLARAERMARRLATPGRPGGTQRLERRFRIVLTGMSRSERISVCEAIRQLNGRIQKEVDRKTTHVILGSCREDKPNSPLEDITGIQPFNDLTCSDRNGNCTAATYGDTRKYPLLTGEGEKGGGGRPRTLHALEGAARGCRVVSCLWALESAKEGKWLYPDKYEIAHLRKLAQKARIERQALGLQNREYSYDVFNGLRIKLTETAEQRNAAATLLKLCGAVEGSDVVVGKEPGQTVSKWIFDSVAAGRPRTRRRYIVPGASPRQTNRQINTQDDFITIISSDEVR